MCKDKRGDDDCGKRAYGVDQKIMIIAIVSLFSVAVIVLILHLYARFLIRRQARRRAVIHHQNLVIRAMTREQPNTGLDPLVISSLPIFIYKQTDRPEDASIECSVCLSALEEGEIARLLPNCKHAFHAKCIDMWLKSNLTCPICRTEVEPRSQAEPGGTETVEPSAPPLESLDGAEGTASDAATLSSKASGSGSRLSSFRKMITREKSERRVQPCDAADASEDPERV